MATFFTSDLHFGHANVIKYVPRPFKDVEEMDAELSRRWNAVVGPKDEVYVVGDFSLCKRARALEIAMALNGVKYLVRGNHDKEPPGAAFAWIKDMHTVKVDVGGQERRIVLCHYAMRVWDRAHYGAWHLYGHSHGSLPDDPNALSLDIGVDSWNYTPVSIAQIAERMAQKTWKPVDHHGEDR